MLSAGPHLYSWVKRDTVTLKNLASEHTSITWPELEPRPPDLEFSAQKTRPKSFIKSKLTVTYVEAKEAQMGGGGGGRGGSLVFVWYFILINFFSS